MTKRIGVGLVSILAALGVAFVPQSPASASGTNGPLCRLVSNAYMYNNAGNRIATVHRGHDFRVHTTAGWSGTHYWVRGHSGEAPSRDGWIIAYTTSGNDNLRRGCWQGGP